VDPVTGTNLLRETGTPRLLWKLALRRQADQQLVWFTSDQASECEFTESQEEAGPVLTITTRGLPGSDLAVAVRVSLPADSSLSTWRMTVTGVPEGLAVQQVICPLVSGLVRLGDPAPGESLLAPVQGEAYLFRNPFPVRDNLPLCAGPGPEMADVGVGQIGGRYPGQIAVQMMAWYNDQCGLYLATHDAGQHPKELRMGPWADLGPAPVLTVAHLCSEFAGEDLAVAYDTVLGLFHGDWYDAAAIYKHWATQQWWCAQKLWDRDIASWLREGVGGVWQMSNYHIPRLEMNHPAAQIADTVNTIAAEAGVPLLGLLFNWEAGGPGPARGASSHHARGRRPLPGRCRRCAPRATRASCT
jgi:hypothetical protein